jgi:hypothetical protein
MDKSTKKSIFTVLITELIIYAVQFRAAPLLFPQYFPSSNEAFGIQAISTAIITLIAVNFSKPKAFHWIFGALLYAALILIYMPPGAYGIGMVGITLDGSQAHYEPDKRYLGILICAAGLLIIQIIVNIIVKLFDKMKKNNNR